MGETTKSYFTAKQARERMLESQVLKNHVYREIRESANEGKNRARWEFWDTAPEVREALLNDLKADGYTVELDPDMDADDYYSYRVVISW